MVDSSIPRLRTALALSAGVVALSFAAVLIRLTEAPALVIAAGRLAVASLVLAPFFWTRFGRIRPQLAGGRWLWVGLAGVFLAVHFALWVESLRHTSVASSVVLVAMDPLFVSLAAPLVLRERPRWQTFLAVGLGVIGALLVAGPSLGSALTTKGNLLALGGAACAAGYLLVGRRVRQEVELVAYVYVMYTVAAVLLLLAVAVLRLPLAGYSISAYGFILLLGLGPQLIGHTSFNWALRYLTAPVVAMVILFEPVGASLLAWLILHEPPTLTEVAGGVVICAAIYLAVTAGFRRRFRM